MSTRRWGLRAIVAAGFTSAVALALLVAYRASLGTVQSRLDAVLPADSAQRIAQDVSDAYFGAMFVVLVAALVLGVVIAGAAADRLDLLRTEILARARGATTRTGAPPSHIAEVQALTSAVELLASEFAERSAMLSRERDELALLVHSVSEGILQLDGQGRIVRANPAAAELLGLPRNPRGQAVGTIVRHNELRRLLQDAARGDAPPASELAFEEHRLLVISRAFEEAGARGTIVTLVDLTELRRLEDVRRDFVANVSHELKTPLTSIRGYAETLLTDDLSPGMQRQFLDVIQNNANRLHRIVEDLLDLSRLESGGWRPEPRVIDPVASARETWTACAERAAAKTLTFDVAGDSVPTLADPGGLRQVLANLYDNAIRHTPAGGSIAVRVRAADDRAGQPATVLEVADTGTGIPRDALARIFERFYRVDPARSRAEGGTGLGLSIVKHLVERMGGSVEAESELGKGTLVRVRLPAVLPHDIDSSQHAERTG